MFCSQPWFLYSREASECGKAGVLLPWRSGILDRLFLDLSIDAISLSRTPTSILKKLQIWEKWRMSHLAAATHVDVLTVKTCGVQGLNDATITTSK